MLFMMMLSVVGYGVVVDGGVGGDGGGCVVGIEGVDGVDD